MTVTNDGIETVGDLAADPRPTTLWNRRFVGLVVTQFAGATNDNVLKAALLVAFAAGGRWSDTLGDAGTGIVNLMLTVPFVLLLGWAGQLSDRLSKSGMIIATRIAEVPIGILVLAGFLLDSPWLVLVAFLLLASESAMFGPAKYGCLPEIVPASRVNEANGLVNMTTNIAILLGIVLGGMLLGISEAAVGGAVVGFACLGLGSSVLMRGLRPVNPGLHRRLNPFAPYLDAIRTIRPGLVWDATLAWSWFYAAAIVVLAVMPQYRGPLGLSETESGLLLASVGVGIGFGCVTAGMLSGPRIRGWFTVGGGLVVATVFWVLGMLQPDALGFWTLWGCFAVAGVGAGFFLIPLQAIQQLCSPPGERARVVATANAMSFALMSLASAIYTLVVTVAEISPFRAMSACGVLLFAVVGWIARGGGRSILFARSPEAEPEMFSPPI